VTSGTPLRCYYTSAGESAATVEAADLASKNITNCSLVGCALGVEYMCCADLAADPAGAATYSGSYGASSGGELTILRTGAQGQYGEIILVNSPGKILPGYELTLFGSWGVEFAANLPKGTRAIPNNAIGGHGTIQMRASGADCVLDAHLTLFSTDVGTTSPVQSVRFDVDGLVILNAPAALCGAAEVGHDAGPDGGNADTTDGPATCAPVDGSYWGGAPFYCVQGYASGYPNNICGDTGPNATCVNGNWTCPGGTIPYTQCGCFASGSATANCTCSNTRWVCPDAGAGDVPDAQPF
jgi:hypothetical protein